MTFNMDLEPDESEHLFLQRVAAELAVTMKEYLTRKELALERDRLRVLHQITNALVSKLSPDELFAAISGQLERINPILLPRSLCMTGKQTNCSSIRCK